MIKLRDARSLLVVYFALLVLSHAELHAQNQGILLNKGQWHASWPFVTYQNGIGVGLSPQGFAFVFQDLQKAEALHHRELPVADEVDLTAIDGYLLTSRFHGANPTPLTEVFGQQETRYHFFQGTDSTKWQGNVPAYQGVIYRDWYPCIDFEVAVHSLGIKTTLTLQPGADPSVIRWSYPGAEVCLNHDQLELNHNLGYLFESAPVAWQEIEGQRVYVEIRYRVKDGVVDFEFPCGYSSELPLIIDPILIFSTYSGSTADNWGSTATPGENGTLYSAGVTNHFAGDVFSGTFPATSGAFQTTYGGLYDVGILKYDSLGSRLLYAAYLGGSESESPHSMIITPDEELIVMGTTSSRNFPTTFGAVQRTYGGGIRTSHVVSYNLGSDLFVARISKTGSSLIGSTYLGGNNNDGLNPSDGVLVRNYGDELRGDVITDELGNVYVSSVTLSADFPKKNSTDSYHGGTDAVIVKLAADLQSILWSGFLGGLGDDAAHTLKLAKDGTIYVAGGTSSTNLPTTGGSQQPSFLGVTDGWIAHLQQEPFQVLELTYVGGTGYDQIYFLDLNSEGKVYVFGQTTSSLPITPATYSVNRGGQFIQKFNATLSALEVSTVLGSGRGVPDISPTAFMVNDCGNIYMAGWGGSILNDRVPNGVRTSTLGLPATPDAYQRTTKGNDFYLAVLADDASALLYATFLGGGSSNTHVDGGTSRFQKTGLVYHAVCAGCGGFSDFPTTTNSVSRRNRSTNCNNLAFKFDLATLKAAIQTNTPTRTQPGITKVCLPDGFLFQNKSIGGETFTWDFGDDFRVVKTDTTAMEYHFPAEGTYRVKLVISDPGTCQESDSTSVVVMVSESVSYAQESDRVCGGVPYTLKAYGAMEYNWYDEAGDYLSDAAQPEVLPEFTQEYRVEMLEANGCTNIDTVALEVVPELKLDLALKLQGECKGVRPPLEVTFSNLEPTDFDRVWLRYGDGDSTENAESIHNYAASGWYQVHLIGLRETCVVDTLVNLFVGELMIPNVITPALQDGSNDSFQVLLGGQPANTVGQKVELEIVNKWGREVFQSDDYVGDWTGEGLTGGVYYFRTKVGSIAVCKGWVHLIRP